MYVLSAWSEQLSELLKLHIPVVIMRQEEGAFPAPGRCPRCLSQGAYSPCSNPGGTGLAIDQFHLYSDFIQMSPYAVCVYVCSLVLLIVCQIYLCYCIWYKLKLFQLLWSLVCLEFTVHFIGMFIVVGRKEIILLPKLQQMRSQWLSYKNGHDFMTYMLYWIESNIVNSSCTSIN